MNKVPKKVKELAEDSGFNRVKYAGQLDSARYYSVGVVDKDGFSLPIGLPHFIVVADGRCSLIDGEEGLEVLRKLFRDE